MAPFFTRSASRNVILLGTILIFLLPFLLFSFLVNRWFVKNESSILASLNETFRVPVTIHHIHYSLFWGILIEDVVFQGGADPALPAPIHVARIRIRPSISFFPHFGFQLGRVVFEEPTFSLRTTLQDAVRLGRFLNTSPQRDQHFGHFYFSTRLHSLEILRGKMTLLAPSPGLWQQEFDGVHLFLGRRLWGGERLVLGGYVAGDPESSFRIRADVKNPHPEATHLDLFLDFQKFATAYLKPYLKSQLELPDQELTAALRIKIRHGKSFVSKGRIAFQGEVEGKNLPSRAVAFISSLKYEVRGEFEQERCLLKKIVLKTRGVELKGEGEMRLSREASAYTISIASGKTPIRKFYPLIPALKTASGHAQLFFTLIGSKERFSPSLEMILENGSLYDPEHHLSWSKVDGRIAFSKDRIIFKEIWAFLNNFPMRLRGELQRLDPPRLFLEVVTYPGQLSVLRYKNPFNATLRFIGEYDRKGWGGDLWVTNVLYRERGQEESRWKLVLHGLRIEEFLPERWMRDLSEGRKVVSRSLLLRQEGKAGTASVAMRKASFFVSGEPGFLRCDLLEGPFGGGALFLQSWADMRNFPNFSWNVNGSVSNADMALLLNRVDKRFPLTGRLTAEGKWSHKKNVSQFLGRFHITDGMIGPTVPLQRFADETGIEPLRQIQFREFSGHVTFLNGDFDLDHWKIVSNQAELLANVKVRDERLDGILSATFPKDSLRKSSNLRKLLNYVGEKEHVDFDFRIVGSLGVPRIQWLSGEFKRKVEARLSPALRKQLAKEMERILADRGVGGVSQ